MIANTNDGRSAPPRMVRGLSASTFAELPSHSAGPKGDLAEQLAAVHGSGYEAVQFVKPQQAAAAGWIQSAITRNLGDVAALRDQIRLHQDAGCDSTTVHLGTGYESADAMVALGEAVLAIADQQAYPVYVETHRATMTQDIARTLSLVDRLPDLRFTLDFGQWYLGHEIPYGGVDLALAQLEPIFSRTRLLHLRLASGSRGQIASDEPGAERHLEVFARAWRAAFRGFIAAARPGDYIGAYAELLPPRTGYALCRVDETGQSSEIGDRWIEAGRLMDLAELAFADAAAASAITKPDSTSLLP